MWPVGAIALGATGSSPFRYIGSDIRPTCQSWSKMRPPALWTARVTSFQPSTCSARPDARRVGIADAHRGDRRGLRDDQPGRGPLRVILGTERNGNPARAGAATGERSQDRRGSAASIRQDRAGRKAWASSSILLKVRRPGCTLQYR